MKLPRAEIVLPFVIVLGATVLIASEFMVAFEFTPPGGEALREQTNADRHSYAMALLAIGALMAMATALVLSGRDRSDDMIGQVGLRSGARAAAFATAGFGVVALLIFLVGDLPDAGKLGDLSDPIRGFASVKAEPQAGFWLEAIGAVTLAVGGCAFATLSPEQLQAPLSRQREAKRAKREPKPAPEAPVKPQ
jgi:hypothetical protein